MKAKKTIHVGDILEQVNHILKNDKISQGEKSGITMVMESILHRTGNYEGYCTDATENEYNRFYFSSKTTAPAMLDANAQRIQDGGYRN